MKRITFLLVLTLLLVTLFSYRLELVTSNSETDYPFATGIYIISPLNRTYMPQTIALNVSTYTIDANNIKLSMVYSIDGAINETIPLINTGFENSVQEKSTGFVALPALSYGKHEVKVYLKHTVNNELVHTDNITVYFTISDTIPAEELIPPTISKLSIENKTYNLTDLLLTFNIDKTVSWTGYSLDNQGNKTITFVHDINIFGVQINQTLKELTDGPHSVVVYANNTAEKTGKSEIIYFTIDTKSEHEVPEFTSWIVYPVICSATTIALFFLKKKIKMILPLFDQELTDCETIL